MTFFGIRLWGNSIEGYKKEIAKHLGIFTKTITKLNNSNSSMTTDQGIKEDEVKKKQDEIFNLEAEVHMLDKIKEENSEIIRNIESFLATKKV